MHSRITIALTAAVFGAAAGKYITWGIRSLPFHERLLPTYFKCKTCEKGINWGCYNAGTRQDYVDIFVSAIAAFLSFYFYGFSGMAFLSWFFVMICHMITVIDVRYLIIPDVISLGGCAAGLIYSAFGTLSVRFFDFAPPFYLPLKDSIIGVLAGGGFLYLLAKIAAFLLRKEAMGLGDVKLLMAIGAWASWKGVVVSVITASLFGSIFGLGRIIYRRIVHKEKYRMFNTAIAFGPFLALGFLLYFYLGYDYFLQILYAYQNWIMSFN
ncbi:MAG: prepilin peptidase [Candidatus Riflebacteria bacterium]|nr:prepilin peptidase [Candidatus Riflebacteria bacterium]